MNHKYITCAGFGGTGSSFVSDLMAEFKNVKGCGDYEWTIAYDIDGVSDLQHYIVDDFNTVKVTEGIYRFRRQSGIVAKWYKKKMETDIQGIFDDYINDLVDVKWIGSNTLQFYRYNRLGRIFYDLVGRISLFFVKLFTPNDGYERGIPKPKVLLEVSQGEEKFFEATKKMFGLLLDSLDKKNEYEFLCYDQLVPIFNLQRYSRYFPNMKIVCVDRDPRDLYLLNEFYWHEGWIPSGNIQTYIKWFRLLRYEYMKNINMVNNENVLAIKFEDAIYNYDETIVKIMNFIGLKESDHIYKKKYFNPEYSIRNTKLWDKIDSRQKEIKMIEDELTEFCYKY